MKKIFGWILLVIGVLIIVWGIWTSFQIFTAQKPVYEIFEVPTAQESFLGKEKGGIGAEVQEQMQQVIKEQFKEMFPPEFLVKILNLSAWWIFMMILILGGGKLAVLGITLLK